MSLFALLGILIWIDEKIRAIRVAKRLRLEDRHLAILCRADPPPAWVQPDCSVEYFLQATQFPREFYEFFSKEYVCCACIIILFAYFKFKRRTLKNCLGGFLRATHEVLGLDLEY